MSSLAGSLLQKIESRRARTGIVGLGYVGLPLAVELANAGFHATGIDLDERKIQAINDGQYLIPRMTREQEAMPLGGSMGGDFGAEGAAEAARK